MGLTVRDRLRHMGGRIAELRGWVLTGNSHWTVSRRMRDEMMSKWVLYKPWIIRKHELFLG